MRHRLGIEDVQGPALLACRALDPHCRLLKSGALALKKRPTARRRPEAFPVHTIADLYGQLRFTVVPPLLIVLAAWASAPRAAAQA